MSDIQPSLPPVAPITARAPERQAEIVPFQAPSLGEGDRTRFASAPGAWAAATAPKVDAASKAELKAIAAQALGYLANEGLSDADKAELYFVASAAHGRLSDMEDQTGNGKKAYAEIAAAASLAPHRLDVVSSYAEAVNELVKRGGFTRGFAENILGVKTQPEARKALEMLANFPGDAQGQAYRYKFATFAKDPAGARQALEALAKLSPEAVAAACRAARVTLP